MPDSLHRLPSRTQSESAHRIKTELWPLAMWGILLFTLGQVIYLMGVMLGAIHRLFGGKVLTLSQGFLWWSGLPVVVGITLSALDLIFLTPKRRGGEEMFFEAVPFTDLTVGLTAVNEV